MSPIPGTGEFRPRRAGHCRRPAAGGKRGPDTKVSCPLLRLPNFPLAATPCGRAAKVRGTQLKPRYHRRLFDAVWGWLRARFPRMTVRGSECRVRGVRNGRVNRCGSTCFYTKKWRHLGFQVSP